MKIEYNETYRSYMVNGCNETDNITVTTENTTPTISVNGVKYMPVSVLDSVKGDIEQMMLKIHDTANGCARALAAMEKAENH